METFMLKLVEKITKKINQKIKGVMNYKNGDLIRFTNSIYKNQKAKFISYVSFPDTHGHVLVKIKDETELLLIHVNQLTSYDNQWFNFKMEMKGVKL